VRAIVTHREEFGRRARLAQNQPSYVKALLYPNGEDGDGPT
jgi:hypothetical protein